MSYVFWCTSSLPVYSVAIGLAFPDILRVFLRSSTLGREVVVLVTNARHRRRALSSLRLSGASFLACFSLVISPAPPPLPRYSFGPLRPPLSALRPPPSASLILLQIVVLSAMAVLWLLFSLYLHGSRSTCYYIKAQS